MGSAYYIVLERDIKGLDTSMDGKSIAKNIKALDAAAAELGIRPLSEFVSIPPEDLAEVLEDHIEDELGAVQFFSAEEGLETVAELLENANLKDKGVIEDLQECERILNTAADGGVAWHFQIDL
jgi:hypothetical protein